MKIFVTSKLICNWFCCKLTGILTSGYTSLFFKSAIAYTTLYACGGLGQMACAVELFHPENGTFIENFHIITNGAIDYRAAEVTEFICNYYPQVLGVEYYDVFSQIVANVTHSCSLDVLIALPRNLTASGLGDFFVYKGYMGETVQNPFLPNFTH